MREYDALDWPKGKAKGTGGYAGPDMSAFDKIRQQEKEHGG